MRNYLMLDIEHAKLKGFSTSNRGKATTLRIEIETSDAWALGMMLNALQEAQTPEPKPEPAARSTPKVAKTHALPPPQLRLPAPGDRS